MLLSCLKAFIKTAKSGNAWFSPGFHHLTQLLDNQQQLKTNTMKQSNTADIKECEQ